MSKTKKKLKGNIIDLRMIGALSSDEEKKKPKIFIKNITNKLSKEIIEMDETYINDDEKIKNIFTYDDQNIITLVDKENKPWFRGRDICMILEYKKPSNAMIAHVSQKYRKSYADLGALNQGPPLKIDPQTIFISQTGLFQLISHSKMPKAIAFYEWIAEEVIPEVLTTGTYTMPTKQTDVERLNKSFYDDNMLSNYENKHVVYLGYIGKYSKKFTLKFGQSDNFPTRDLISHRKTYGKFIVIQIWEVIANHQAEQKIKMNFKSKNMLTELKFKRKNRTELVTLNGINDLDYCIKMMTEVVNTTKSHTEIELTDKIIKTEHQIELLQKDLHCSTEILEHKNEIIKQLKLRLNK